MTHTTPTTPTTNIALTAAPPPLHGSENPASSTHKAPPPPPTRRHATNKCAGVVLIDPWCGNANDPRTYRIMVIQQKYSGVWGLPKGHLELDEEVHAAAWRELSEETGVHLDRLVHGVDYIPVEMQTTRTTLQGTGSGDTISRTTSSRTTNYHSNHIVIKKIHFFVYMLLRQGSSLVHSTHDTKEVAAISWMDVHHWEIEPHPKRLEVHQLPNGQTVVVPVVHSTPASAAASHARRPGNLQPPRFNRTLADTSVLQLQEVCTKAALQLAHRMQQLSQAHTRVPHYHPRHPCSGAQNDEVFWNGNGVCASGVSLTAAETTCLPNTTDNNNTGIESTNHNEHTHLSISRPHPPAALLVRCGGCENLF